MEDAGQNYLWTLSEYCRECGGMIDVEQFSAIVVEDKNLVMCDRNNSLSETALGAWKRRWAVFQKWCTKIMIDTRIADMTFIRCEKYAGHCCRMRDFIDARMVGEDWDPQLQYCLFEKPYTSHCLMHDGSHSTCTSEVKVLQRIALWNRFDVGWHHLVLSTLPPTERHRYCITLTLLFQDWETHRVLCTPTLPMFAHLLALSQNGCQLFRWLLRKTASTELTLILFDCFN